MNAVKTLTMRILTSEECGHDDTTRRIGSMVVKRHAIFTIEKPWVPNPDAPDGIGGGVPFESCVPKGEYELVHRYSPSKQGNRWHFHNPDLHVYLGQSDMEHDWERYGCMIHIASMVQNVVGDIGPGLRMHDFGEQGGLGVASSAVAMDVISNYLLGETTARLRIV